uniref:Hemagglutinin n=1 Tax=Macrostomum lignano TaxID=282301 RepID=A0A1I8IJB6_9PLAT
TAKQKSSTSSIDSREIHRRFANKDYENKLKQGWIFAAETHNEDLANDHYSPTDTGEFIARAKSAASQQADRVRSLRIGSAAAAALGAAGNHRLRS